VQYSKTTRREPQMLPQNIYYFSNQLGWYIVAKYFAHGKAIAEYQVANYQ
jgi:hypothetical protein